MRSRTDAGWQLGYHTLTDSTICGIADTKHVCSHKIGLLSGYALKADIDLRRLETRPSPEHCTGDEVEPRSRKTYSCLPLKDVKRVTLITQHISICRTCSPDHTICMYCHSEFGVKRGPKKEIQENVRKRTKSKTITISDPTCPRGGGFEQGSRSCKSKALTHRAEAKHAQAAELLDTTPAIHEVFNRVTFTFPDSRFTKIHDQSGENPTVLKGGILYSALFISLHVSYVTHRL